MKIFANKEIKKLSSCSIRYLGSLPSVDTRVLMVVLSAVFFVPIACFRIGRRSDIGGGLFLFQKAKSSHGTGSITDSMRILTAITMPVLNVMMRANYIGCFIPLILWRLS